MDIYDHPTFRMACQQFDLVADLLQVPEAERARLKFPKRSMTVALPIKRDDGSTEVFSGYRVQHHLTLGPTKGGTRFAPSLSMGETAALVRLEVARCHRVNRDDGAVTEVIASQVIAFGQSERQLCRLVFHTFRE